MSTAAETVPAPPSPLREPRRSSFLLRPSQLPNGSSLDDEALVSLPVNKEFARCLSSDGLPTGGSPYARPHSPNGRQQRPSSRIFDDAAVVESYSNVPLLEVTELPRGGISVETKAVGRVQFGIPPETIKDSMLLGIEVPRIYIVPVDRFCRDFGPALGINLAEFEFPAYFNYFVRRKKCILVVDSDEAEQNIRSVFEETLLGPKQFRDHSNPKANEDEDFDPSFPAEKKPNFYKEFLHFRVSEKTDVFSELHTDQLLEFCHFGDSKRVSIGVPPIPPGRELEDESGPTAWDALNGSVRKFNVAPPLSSSVPETKSRTNDYANRRTLRSFLDDPKHLPRRLSFTSISSDGVGCRRGSVQSRPPAGSRSSITSLNGGVTNSPTKTPRRTSFASDASGSDGELPTYLDDSTEYKDQTETDTLQHHESWMFSKVRWLAEVATVWPMDATPEQIKERSVPRVEIFKMPGGADYIVHDVDENNYLIGKAKFNGTVGVPDEIAVEGFDCPELEVVAKMNSVHSIAGSNSMNGRPARTPHTFLPPSFGLTVLGNSHGFDRNGSTSGYVLWINGRGVMIDPPPYSSATLEREGIQPQTIIGVIVTHCHADHDAGAFQKVLTGSRVAIITAPTIYRSFIRKYSALSGLNPNLLRRSHRFRPAIIGQPLKFQGATFHFNYTFHTIPCISFKVEWRGRSMVFTGDHCNIPTLIDELEQSGVFSKGRADSLRDLPLQDCDALLHEAGAPPIHTPLAVLQALPTSVKERLYVVHTSALPTDSDLRVAPTGTAGTIRLDQKSSPPRRTISQKIRFRRSRTSSSSSISRISLSSLDDGGSTNFSVIGEYTVPKPSELNSSRLAKAKIPPLVFMRPTCVSDAWFMLNLLSNIPFFASLSYSNTMEVLEIAAIQVFCVGEVVIPAARRQEILCVVWEGRLVESDADGAESPCIWHAGDWTGPLALQPKYGQSSEIVKRQSGPRDVIAGAAEGVKVIVLQMVDLEKILQRGSELFRRYLSVQQRQAADETVLAKMKHASAIQGNGSTSSSSYYHVLEVIKCNSVLRKLPALPKRSLESIADGPRVFDSGATLWKLGDRCDDAFLIVSGTASFGSTVVPLRSPGGNELSGKRRGSAGSVLYLEDGRSIEADKLLYEVAPDSEYSRLESYLSQRVGRVKFARGSAQESNDRFANKVLSRLYASRKYTTNMVFSRGCFLCDTSRMVSGELVRETLDATQQAEQYSHSHSTSLVAGLDGCVAMVFPRSTLVPFLDANPGVLLSLLGTQVVV